MDHTQWRHCVSAKQQIPEVYRRSGEALGVTEICYYHVVDYDMTMILTWLLWDSASYHMGLLWHQHKYIYSVNTFIVALKRYKFNLCNNTTLVTFTLLSTTIFLFENVSYPIKPLHLVCLCFCENRGHDCMSTHAELRRSGGFTGRSRSQLPLLLKFWF